MRVMLLGATGLVGQGVLQALRGADDVQRIVLPTRRRIDGTTPREEQHVLADLAGLDARHPALQNIDACLDCIGVVPGLSEADYHAVTVDLNVHLAKVYAEANPGGVFAYVSGAGSRDDSPLMPLRVKGIAERELRALPVATVMLRPGIVQPVDGVRSPHALRAALYAVGAPVMGLARTLAPAAVTTTTAVGRAMLAAVRSRSERHVVLENADINRLGAA